MSHEAGTDSNAEKDYNGTLNLPKTEFPMRAGLAKREPEMLAEFYAKNIYEKVLARNAGKPGFILHDGPPFSNGDIHIGTAANKILKDIIVRYKNMSGYNSPYTPGWDNHGMPIESAIIKKNKLDRKKMSITEFRSACRDFALDFVNRQRESFKRLGVVGDWEHPYLTLDPKFEAEEIRVFGSMYEQGYIYRGLKPVYWCPTDETALAEAEIEYADDPCTAIFVKFKITEDSAKKASLSENTYFVIWTTTAWTLPGNLAVCLNPETQYAIVNTGDDNLIIAEPLVDSVMKAAGITQYSFSGTMPGASLERLQTRHPFYERTSLVITGDHVTTEAGTGCVHTAPGFGAEDFEVCKKYPELKTIVPVDGRGIMTDDALQYAGEHYTKANDRIISDLEASGALLASERLTHSYPHCWRCKNPIIFRATKQWFASVDAIKDEAVAATEDIRWLPGWGRERMQAMIRERSDWCISRQRHWGLPIPVFYCDECGKPVCTNETIESVAAIFAERGSNAWFELPAESLLPEGYACPHCAAAGKRSDSFTKETDTLDGWFDSGSTHAAVLEHFERLQSPADIYLEGGDQYRGWFQSSMLTSIATRKRAPYRIVITHGWTVDENGKQMHKSIGNTVAPEEVIREYGADILRLWVASTDYHNDMRIGPPILKQLSDIYLKIRNTARFILGNLGENFNPNDLSPYEELWEIDKFALSKLSDLTESVRDSYENYEYHPIYHGIHDFCAVTMSNFYLDIIKDRLYCDPQSSASGRAARTVIFHILDTLVRLLAPILVFTADEIWKIMPHASGDNKESVLLNDIPVIPAAWSLSPKERDRWDKLLALRREVNSELERARADKLIGKPLEAEVNLYVSEDYYHENAEILDYGRLAELFIVSKAEVIIRKQAAGLEIEVIHGGGVKCPRCWTLSHEPDADGLCPRCAAVISAATE